MVKYVVLVNLTDQGIKSIKDGPKRLDAVRALAKQRGCEMAKFFMTVGAYDFVAVFNAPDDEAMAGLLLAVGAAGNVRTTTLKAFSEASYRKIVGALT